MKAIKTIMIILSISTINILAQIPEPGNNGAKQYFKRLVKQQEELRNWDLPNEKEMYESRLVQCDQYIEYIISYDKTYDVTLLRNEQDKLKQRLIDAQNKSDGKETDVKKLMAYIFKAPGSFYDNATIDDCSLLYEKYKTEVNDFINNDGKNRLANAMKHVTFSMPDDFNSEKNGFEKEVKYNEESIYQISELSATRIYYKLHHYKIYWEAAYTLMNEVEFKSNLDLVTKSLIKLGSLQDVKNKLIQRDKDLIANKKVRPAVRKDTETENLFESAFNQMISKMGWTDKIVQINLLHNDWATDFHAVTGVILGRHQSACIQVIRDGKCFVYDAVHLYQDYTGTSYTNSRCGHNYLGPDEMLCK